MTTNPSNLLSSAKQGNPKAIAVLISRSLQSKGITAKAAIRSDCLQIMLESAQVPEQQALVPFVQRGISRLNIESFKTLKVFGKQRGADLPAWTEEVQLQNSVKISSKQEFQSTDTSVSKIQSASASRIEQVPLDKTPSKPASNLKSQLKWYETDSPILTVGLLCLFFPLGLWSMWRYTRWSRKTKMIVTAIISTLILAHGVRSGKQGVQVTQASTETQPTALVDPNSNIGKVDQTGTTIMVDMPNHPSCSREYVSVKLDTFENCLIEGLTYVQVANVLGYRGELQAKSGDTEIWQWNDGSGKYLSATFFDGKLVSRSQIGLIDY
jgi:hypothetical protein